VTKRPFRARAILASVAILAAAAGIGLALWNQAPPQRADSLFALALPDTEGVTQRLGQWQGKVVVVNFWATWCEPCREEMPEFVRVQRELGPKGLQFVGIAVDQPDKVVAFAKELGLNYPALVGGYDAMELSRNLGNQLVALPFTIVIDRQGAIAYTQLGPVKKGQLRPILDKLL
jgi:thiol-disulfide isomerase/thioredoxin